MTPFPNPIAATAATISGIASDSIGNQPTQMTSIAIDAKTRGRIADTAQTVRRISTEGADHAPGQPAQRCQGSGSDGGQMILIMKEDRQKAAEADEAAKRDRIDCAEPVARSAAAPSHAACSTKIGSGDGSRRHAEPEPQQ